MSRKKRVISDNEKNKNVSRKAATKEKVAFKEIDEKNLRMILSNVKDTKTIEYFLVGNILETHNESEN